MLDCFIIIILVDLLKAVHAKRGKVTLVLLHTIEEISYTMHCPRTALHITINEKAHMYGSKCLAWPPTKHASILRTSTRSGRKHAHTRAL